MLCRCRSRHRRRGYIWPLVTVLLLLATIFFNEYLIYYTTIWMGCSWPSMSSSKKLPGTKRILIIADTHLLGRIRGHWFDKLRREWQMYRAFQTTMQLMEPDAVFFLGDQFDEGQWTNEEDFIRYTRRFESIFNVPKHVKRFVVAGNHDIGFHYEIIGKRLGWFNELFMRRNLVDHITLGDSHIVMLNSMAMEGDGCELCESALNQLQQLSKRFDCARNHNQSPSSSSAYRCDPHHPLAINNYSPPIIMQHFPLFRRSDHRCDDEADAAPEPQKSEQFREKWDCLSAEATQFLLRSLKPRAVFAGHTHYGCKTWWPSPYSFWEWTVPSFSWRNTAQPTLLLVIINAEEVVVSKCFLPNEMTVIKLYIAAVCACVLAIVYQVFVFLCWPRSNK